MDGLIPGKERIRPHYPKAGRGRRPYELSSMLRIHCVQLFYNLSEWRTCSRGRVGETVRGTEALRAVAGRDNLNILEERRLGQGLMEEKPPPGKGLKLREGTIVDASIIEAPSSTKNGACERDPQMRQTKKGNEWHFGMKVHIGVDSETGVVHSMPSERACVGAGHMWGDAQGVAKREENEGLDE